MPSLARFLFKAIIIAHSSCVAQPATPIIGIYASSPKGTQVGTGFTVGNGDLITAYHVIQRSKTILLRDSNKNLVDVAGLKIRYVDGKTDIAVLNVPALINASKFNLSDRTVSTAENLHSIGYPNGMADATVAARAITDKPVLPADSPFVTPDGPILLGSVAVIPLDMTIYGGQSGAPLLDAQDNVLGLISGSLGLGGSFTWAIPSAQILMAIAKSKTWTESLNVQRTWPNLDLVAPYAKESVRSFSTRAKIPGDTASRVELLKQHLVDISNGPAIYADIVAEDCIALKHEIEMSVEFAGDDKHFKLLSFGISAVITKDRKDYLEFKSNVAEILLQASELNSRFREYIEFTLPRAAWPGESVEGREAADFLEQFQESGKLEAFERSLAIDGGVMDEWFGELAKIDDPHEMSLQQSKLVAESCPRVMAAMSKYYNTDKFNELLDYYNALPGLLNISK